MGMGERSLKAQLRQANSLGARYAVIIGEEEVRSNTASLREMTTAKQRIVPIADLQNLLK
jgi:histidyl-tRNA synthetase